MFNQITRFRETCRCYLAIKYWTECLVILCQDSTPEYAEIKSHNIQICQAKIIHEAHKINTLRHRREYH